MGTKYSSQSTSGYNASPPADDGTAVASNEVKWSFIKTKLADVLKTFAEAINTALLLHLDESVLDKAVAFTTTVAEHKRTINITVLATQSLGDASTMGVGYIVTVKNSHTAANTVDLATGADTLDGTADGSVVLEPDGAITFAVNAGADGYKIVSGFESPKNKIIDIGDWNMDTTLTKTVAHGLTQADIRSVDVWIRDDVAAFTYPLFYHGSGGSHAGYYKYGATTVDLTRVVSGFFDSATFDATSFNRGWVTIWYV